MDVGARQNLPAAAQLSVRPSFIAIRAKCTMCAVFDTITQGAALSFRYPCYRDFKSYAGRLSATYELIEIAVREFEDSARRSKMRCAS